MDDLYAFFYDLPEELKVLVLSHIEHVKTRQILALLFSSTFEEAFSLPGALPRTFDFGGIAGDDIADHLVRLLDDDRVRSLEKERALELVGDDKDRLCEYACGRNFLVLKWAHRELELPWAPYPAERVSDDVLVLRVLRGAVHKLEGWELEDAVRPEEWDWVLMEDGRVVELELDKFGVTGAVPAELGHLTALVDLDLSGSRLTSIPAEIGQLTSLKVLRINKNQLTSVPAEIGQLASLEKLYLDGNQLTSLPAEIGQLASLRKLYLNYNRLTSVPAEIEQLRSLERLYLGGNRLTSVPAEIGQLTSLEKLGLECNQLTSVPAEIGQLTSLSELYLHNNRLTSVPAEIGQLTSLWELFLLNNQLTSVPAAIRELKAAGCRVPRDAGVTVDESERTLVWYPP